MTAPRLVFVTDPGAAAATTVAVIRAASAALGPGRLAVQLRDKGASADELARTARELRVVTRDAGALLVVNGALEVAVEVGADGVHLPDPGGEGPPRVADARLRLGPRAFVSLAAHDDAAVRHAIKGGASAVLVSPIFVTKGKGAPRGVEAITRARELVGAAPGAPRVLVYALGGVDARNVGACRAAGADGVAAIRALYDGDAAALGAAFAGATA